MQLSLFSISYAGLWGQAQVPLRQFVRRAAELGFDAVMLAGKRPQLAPVDVDEALIAGICDDLRTAGVTCPVVAAYTDLGAKVAAEVPFLEMQLSYVEALAGIGAKLGARFVRVFTAYDLPGLAAHQTWQTVVKGLREMSDRVARHGLTLAIQNHHDLAVHTDALLELLLDVDRPNCKLGFDAWSPALRGEEVY
jgi:sugar phosphate isomerase/epimerase